MRKRRRGCVNRCVTRLTVNRSLELNAAPLAHDFTRFLQAQERDYETALAQIKDGRKRSHWMWYIFPQFDGLGFSATSKHYAIKSIAQAQGYLCDEVLGPRLTQCAQAVLAVKGRSALEIFGAPDDMKLKSCATLFAQVSLPGSVFEQILDQYYQGERDLKTLGLIEQATEPE